MVTYSVDVEDVNIRRSHEQVLDERGEHVPGFELLKPRQRNSLTRIGLTNKKLAMKYNPVVARMEITIFRKIALLNTSSSCN